MGINSWWKLVIAIYNPGNNRVIHAARNLIVFIKLDNTGLKFLSSGDFKKSNAIAGIISAKGVPLTIIITLPSSR